MEMITEKEHICKFCNKKFPSGKSLGGHIRIHTNEYSLHSDSKKKNKNKKRMVDQREITALKQQQQQQQLCCRECGKGFDSLKDLWNHMVCCLCVGEKLVMDSQSDTETTSSSSTRKRSKKQSESFSSSSSAACEIDQEHKNSALSLMMMSMDPRGLTLVVNSLVAELSSGEQLKMIFSVKNQSLLKTDKVAVDDHLRSLAADDDDENSGAILSDSYSSDSDYFMNGPKKSDSDISVDECLSNNRFKNDDELGGVKERGSKYELRKSKRVVLPSYETDDNTNSKIHSKSLMVKKAISGANKNGKGHECPVCFRVFKSGQALGGHKRSHFLGNHQQRIKHKAAAADMGIDLINLPAAHDI